MRAERAHEPLRHHAEQRRGDQIRWHAEVEQPRDRARRIVGMQRRQHEVAGESRLHGHVGGVAIADLADHDDVGVLP